MRLMLRLRNLAAASCAVITVGASLGAAETPVRLQEVRLLIGQTPVYDVTETASAASGETTYDWETPRHDAAMAVGLQYVVPIAASPNPDRPLFWGIEALYHRATIEPSGYSVDGAFFGNNIGERLTIQTLSGSFVAGWRFAQPVDSSLGFFGEFQGQLGLALLHGDLARQSASGTGLGYGLDSAARLVLGLQEQGWSGALVGGVRRTWAAMSIDHGDVSSDYELDRAGFEVFLAVGRTF